MTIKQTACVIDSAIRLLYNSNKAQFSEIFGAEFGPYLWDKFTVHFKANEGAFICYLDFGRQAQLATAVLEYAKKEDPRRMKANDE